MSPSSILRDKGVSFPEIGTPLNWNPTLVTGIS